MAAAQPQLAGRKIQIVGVTGAGKSTFARQLGAELGIPVCELDKLFYTSRAGGHLAASTAQQTVQALINENDEWIVDGNHWVQLKNISYSEATDIIWIDTPFPLTLWRVISRTIREIFTVPGVWRRELSLRTSLILSSMRIRAKKNANWSKRVATDPRWKRLHGWFGRSKFLARLRKQKIG